MIWTEEEDNDRAFATMLDSVGKFCGNCNWGDANVKDEDRSDWTTCGHHHENFKVTSLCAYWTDPQDKKLLVYQKKRKEELIKKLKNGK